MALLRYFNPIGAHECGLIGEDPVRHSQQSDALHHAGRYPAGCEAADRLRRRLRHPRRHRRAGLHPCGGSGQGPSCAAMNYAGRSSPAARSSIWAPAVALQCAGHGQRLSEKANGIDDSLSSSLLAARAISPPVYADPVQGQGTARTGTAEKTLEDMCRDSWRWQKNNPNGYRDA